MKVLSEIYLIMYLLFLYNKMFTFILGSALGSYDPPSWTDWGGGANRILMRRPLRRRNNNLFFIISIMFYLL